MSLLRLSLVMLWMVLLAPASLKAQSDFIKPVTPLPMGRAFHGAAVLGDFLYLIGGTVNTYPGEAGDRPAVTCQVAKIGEDSQVSQWIPTTKLDIPRHYISNSTIVLNDTVYVFGGSEDILSEDSSNTVAWTRPLPNGMVEPWKVSQPFSDSGLLGLAAVTTPGHLHIIGGLDQTDSVTNRIWSAPINPDGGLGAWQQSPPLPVPLWFHCAAVVGGRVFVWGGLMNNEKSNLQPVADIYSAPVLATGKLGQWRKEQMRLPIGFYDASSAVVGPYLFSICPRYAGAELGSDIWWTYVTPEGMLPWTRVETQLPNRAYRATAIDYRRGVIYVTGGKVGYGQDPQKLNYMIQLSPSARAQAEKAWSAGQHAIASSEINYTRGGASSYSFQAQQQMAGSLPGFYNLEAARLESARKGRPMIMYFNYPDANPCKEQLPVLQSEEFSTLLASAVFASVDPVQYPQVAQQYGVFRVPTWIFYDKIGSERHRTVGVQQFEELKSMVSGLN